MKEFNSRETPSGKVAYAFTMTLPKDLPPTTKMLNSQVKSLLSQVEYTLRADLVFNDQIVHQGSCAVPIYRQADNAKFAP